MRTGICDHGIQGYQIVTQGANKRTVMRLLRQDVLQVKPHPRERIHEPCIYNISARKQAQYECRALTVKIVASSTAQILELLIG
jgi:hypothetical protein